MHFSQSKNAAVPPRLKAIYLWERASASQEAKTREKFSLFKAGYFVWEFSAFLVTSWESFVFARSGSSESNLFVGNRLLALCASQKKKKLFYFWGILVRKNWLLALSANTKKQKVFTWAEYLWKTENWFFLGLGKNQNHSDREQSSWDVSNISVIFSCLAEIIIFWNFP